MKKHFTPKQKVVLVKTSALSMMPLIGKTGEIILSGYRTVGVDFGADGKWSVPVEDLKAAQ